ncbi:hypothetical protein EV356DRAFT_7660 [Viridothelium virens]|uniref:Uncharacterized protein n=1 Tax=Viridothelium virens TaxID=1048519 RepID=A0A6A6HPQ8_VIRVR|nr:hypothetical protein EV356DRAFT_7660 [Viridothelium virens]
MGDNLTDFFFTSHLTQWQCTSNIASYFTCIPPSACAHSTSTGQAYCCSNGGEADGCYTEGTKCKTDGSTSTCGGDDQTIQFCCFSEGQSCTQKLGELNVCWGTGANPLAKVNDNQLNATFSSLSSAHPSASTFAFNPAKLQSSTASSPSSARTNAPHHSSHGSLSSGSIAGIVVAAIFAPIIVIGIVMIFGRKRLRSMVQRARQRKGSLDWTLARNNRQMAEADAGIRPELDGRQIPAELAGSAVTTAQELPARTENQPAKPQASEEVQTASSRL